MEHAGAFHDMDEFLKKYDMAGAGERLTLLGIPEAELTPAVKLGVSALLEKLSDLRRELAESKSHLAEMQRLVDADCLVPVANRRAFMRRLEWAVSMQRRYGTPVSILFFDLNGLKALNDTYGHAAGDAAIAHVVAVLKQHLRSSDFLARLGGDEFAAILYHAVYKDAEAKGAQLCKALSKTPLHWEEKEIAVSMACGAHQVDRNEGAEEALDAADKAMYRHKQALKQASGEPA